MMVSTIDFPRKNRLIVLLPDSLAGDLDLARKIYWMAVRDQSEVLYLTLLDDTEKMSSTMYRMVTMKAVTAGNGLLVQSKLTKTSQWLQTLREVYHPGDQVVLHEEQIVKNGFLKTMPITEFLQDRLNVPMITISGFYHPEQIQINQWLHSIAAWLGFLLILVVFTGLEIKLEPVFRGFSGKVLLGILFSMEVAGIWAWNQITGHFG